jgi:hypothetical protein
MRLAWAIVIGVIVGGGLAWWATRDTPAEAAHKQARAMAARAAQAEEARPSLYRWRDAQGRLHVAEQPPKTGRYERIDREPRSGIEINGSPL